MADNLDTQDFPAGEPSLEWSHDQLNAYAAHYNVTDYKTAVTKSEKLDFLSKSEKERDEDVKAEPVSGGEQVRENTNLSVPDASVVPGTVPPVDPEQEDVQEETRVAQPGDTYQEDDYVAVVKQGNGGTLVELKPAVWVGEGFVVRLDEVPALKRLLGHIRSR